MDGNKKISINISGFTITLIFLILKLTHVIEWAWIWIFSPIWIPLAIGLAVLLLYYFMVLIVAIVAAIRGY